MKRKFIWIALMLIPLLLLAADTGYVSPASASNYTNSSNVYTSNDAYATHAFLGAESTYIQVGSFGMSIPAGSTIDGILVSCEYYYTSSTDVACSFDVYHQADKAYYSQSILPPVLTRERTQELGGATDDWGAVSAWSPYEINNLLVRISTVFTGSGGNTHYIDHIQVKVWYTTSGGTQLTVNGISDWVKINKVATADVVKINGITNN